MRWGRNLSRHTGPKACVLLISHHSRREGASDSIRERERERKRSTLLNSQNAMHLGLNQLMPAHNPPPVLISGTQKIHLNPSHTPRFTPAVRQLLHASCRRTASLVSRADQRRSAASLLTQNRGRAVVALQELLPPVCWRCGVVTHSRRAMVESTDLV